MSSAPPPPHERRRDGMDRHTDSRHSPEGPSWTGVARQHQTEGLQPPLHIYSTVLLVTTVFLAILSVDNIISNVFFSCKLIFYYYYYYYIFMHSSTAGTAQARGAQAG